MQDSSNFKISCRCVIAALILAFLLPPETLWASPTGSIGGIVRDPSGLPAAGVRLTIVSATTRAQKTAVTDAFGTFEFLQVEPAVWSLQAEANGFKRASIHQVVVQVDRITRIDLSLELGEISQTVEVSTRILLLDQDKPAVTSVLDNRTIANMPLNGRQFLDLALLAPGIVPAPPGTQGNGFNAAGARAQSNVYLLDGVSNQDTQTNGPLNLFRITEAVQEFAVQNGVPLPEFGRGTGAQVNIVTRTGTNRFHGSLFEYARNTVFDAADFFTNKLGGSKNALIRNHFGGAVGGPVARDRTFFFASYEGFRQVAPSVTSTLVPTPAERATVTDPVSRRLLEYWPLPNAAGSPNYIANVRSTDSDDTALVRLDHRLGDRDQVSARWTRNWGTSFVSGSTPLTGGNEGPLSQVSSFLSEVHTFSPTFLNEFRLGYSRNSESRIAQDHGLDASAILAGPSGLPLPGVVNGALDPLNSGLPTITIGGGYAALGTQPNFPQGRISQTFELFENLSLRAPFSAARHTWRWGVHIRREDLSRYLNRAARGTVNFQNFPDFSRGLIQTSSIRTGSTQSNWRRYPWAVYWQDEFRLRPDLTLNYGVRYEHPSAASERSNRATNFVPGVGPMVVGTNQILKINPALTGPQALAFETAPMTLPSSGAHPDKNNVAPMVGFAYTPRLWPSILGGNDTVIRGGFRISHDDLFNNVFSIMTLGAPHTLLTTQTANVTQPARFPWALAFDQNVPLISNYGRQGPGTPTVGILTFQGIDPDLRSAQAYSYNLEVQRSAGGSLSFGAGYHGSSGRNLGIYMDVNQPTVIVRDPLRRGTLAPNEQVFPYEEFGMAQIARSLGRSSYHGLVLDSTYRGRTGIYVQGSFTLAKSFDFNSSYFGSGRLPGEAGSPIDNTKLHLERGPSAFDMRRRFVLVYLLDLPVGPGHRVFGWNNRFSRAAFGGWKISGITTLQTGTPFTVITGGPDTSGFNQSNPGNSPNGGNRPNLVKPGRLPQDNRNPDAAFDPSWFAPNGAGQNGSSGRNAYYGPGLQNYDFAITKSFPLGQPGEQARLEFRSDFFNLFNHTNFANPISDMSNANFGKITQTLGSAASTSARTSGGTVGGPRQIQLSLRLQF
jgi:hypothetical protein